MHLRQLTLPDEIQAFFKIRFRLAGKAHDEIGRNGAEGKSLAQKAARRKIFCGGIFPVHAPQRAVAAALQRKVEMGADIAVCRADAHKLCVHRARLQRAEADAGAGNGGAQPVQQRGKGGIRLVFQPIRAYLDAGYDYLRVALLRKPDSLRNRQIGVE